MFAPAISGAGSVNVLSGITILTANNTYTGATAISGGALIVKSRRQADPILTVFDFVRYTDVHGRDPQAVSAIRRAGALMISADALFFSQRDQLVALAGSASV